MNNEDDFSIRLSKNAIINLQATLAAIPIILGVTKGAHVWWWKKYEFQLFYGHSFLNMHWRSYKIKMFILQYWYRRSICRRVKATLLISDCSSSNICFFFHKNFCHDCLQLGKYINHTWYFTYFLFKRMEVAPIPAILTVISSLL